MTTSPQRRAWLKVTIIRNRLLFYNHMHQRQENLFWEDSGETPVARLKTRVNFDQSKPQLKCRATCGRRKESDVLLPA